MDERDFARFEFKVGFERMSYIAQHPGFPLNQLILKQYSIHLYKWLS